MVTPLSAKKTALNMGRAVLGLTLLLSLVFLSLSPAQTRTTERSGRRVVHNVEPEYPAIVKHAHVGGLVRLRVTVLANGDVAKVEPLGGNPIFVESATKAVLKWKYVPAATQSKEEIEISFNPD